MGAGKRKAGDRQQYSESLFATLQQQNTNDTRLIEPRASFSYKEIDAEQASQPSLLSPPMSDGALGIFDIQTSDEEETVRVVGKNSNSPSSRRKHGPSPLKTRPTVHSRANSKKSSFRATKSDPTEVLRSSKSLQGASAPDSVVSRRSQHDVVSDVIPENRPQTPGLDVAIALDSPETILSPTRSRPRRSAAADSAHQNAHPYVASHCRTSNYATAKVSVAESSTRRIDPEATGQFPQQYYAKEEAFRKRSSPSVPSDTVSEVEEDEGFCRTLPRPVNRTPSPRKRPRTIDDMSTSPERYDAVSDEKTSSMNVPQGQHFSPRHARLWNQLLGETASDPLSSTLPIYRLGLSPNPRISTRASKGNLESAELTSNTDEDPPDGRMRLIDTLVERLPAANDNVRDRPVDSGSEDEAATAITLKLDVSVPAPKPNIQERIPNRKSHNDMVQSITGSWSTSSQAAAAVQPGGLKITYARQRSYLTDGSLDDGTFGAAPPKNHRSLEDSRQWGIRSKAPAPLTAANTADAEDDGSDQGMNMDIRSVHELRQAGANKRFLDDAEGMLEDIEDRSATSLHKRRIGLLELGTKLADKCYARRFVDLGLERRLFMDLDAERDVIAGFTLASIIALLGRDLLARHSDVRVFERGPLNMLIRLLSLDRDINLLYKDRQYRVSRALSTLITEFVQLSQQSQIWPAPLDSVSPRIMALAALEVLVGVLPDARQLSVSLTSTELFMIVKILAQTFDWKVDSVPPAPKVLEVELGLSFLEACTTSPDFKFGTAAEEVAWTQMITELLLYVCRHPSKPIKRIQISVLRLFLNITNNKSSLCQTVSTAEITEALADVIRFGFSQFETDLSDPEQLSSVDHLILALAAMINLVESSTVVQDDVLKQKSNGLSLLDDLLRSFLQGYERAGEVGSASCAKELTTLTRMIGRFNGRNPFQRGLWLPCRAFEYHQSSVRCEITCVLEATWSDSSACQERRSRVSAIPSASRQSTVRNGQGEPDARRVY